MHTLIMICGIVVLLVVYYVPTMVAYKRGHINATAIFVANFLLGWTVIGWAVAMVWAFTASTAPRPEPRKFGIVCLLKILLTGFATLCMFLVILNTFKHAPPVIEGSSTTQTAPAGVPTPADEILGK
jgi:hypothetical protein